MGFGAQRDNERQSDGLLGAIPASEAVGAAAAFDGAAAPDLPKPKRKRPPKKVRPVRMIEVGPHRFVNEVSYKKLGADARQWKERQT
jgi:hypothetical protein